MDGASAFLTVAIEAARAAEEVILSYYQDDIRVTLKSDQSPVTVADEEAERIIKEVIHARFPEHGFIGEETGETTSASGYQWIIDPIDGTRNYVRQVPIFGTLIALMKDGEVICGVSNLPAWKEMIYAEKGKGAYRGDTRLAVSTKQTIKDAYISYGGLRNTEERAMTPALLGLVRASNSDRGFGDCWQYHLLATGRVDVVVDPKVKIWDVAPAKIIVEEAGGRLTDSVGNALGTGTWTAVASNGLLHNEVLGFFKN